MRHLGDCCAAEAALPPIYTGAGGLVYDALCRDDDCGVPELAASLRDAGASTVIELGAGSGRITLPLLRTGFRVVAVDLSSTLLGLLTRRVAEQGLTASLDVVHADVLDDALGLPRADAVLIGTSTISIFDMAGRRRCLRAMNNLLAPGGAAVVELYEVAPDAPAVGPVPLGVSGSFTEDLRWDEGLRTSVVTLAGQAYESTTHLLTPRLLEADLREVFGPRCRVRTSRQPIAAGRWNTQLVVDEVAA